jgi:putative alpha-1,2-mannosidase
MASYAAFYLVGLYPLPATRQVLLSSPWFPTVNFTNSVTGAITTINAVGFEGNPRDTQTGNIFVQNITVNGSPWKSRCWLDWSVFESGGVVDIHLGTSESQNCGESSEALPASLSTVGYD